MKKLFKLSKDENGQVLVLAALLMTVLMGFAAFAVDIGMVNVTKSKLQNTADAAALAAAASSGNEESTAISYANINGIDDSVEGTEIEVEVNSSAVSVTETTTKKAYTAAEITQKLSELETELYTKSDAELIELAKDNSVTNGLTTTSGTYTSEELNHMTVAELIALANANSIDTSTYLTIGKEKKYSDAYLNSISEMDDLDIINLSKTEDGVYDKIKDYIKSNGKGFENKHRDTAVTIVKNELAKIEIDVITLTDANKAALIDAIVDKLNESGTPVTETKITDKDALITELLEVQKTAWENEEITEGKKKGGSKQVKVTLKKKVSYTFARILGFEEGTVTVHAIAEKTAWDGEDALPFINLDDKYGTPGMTLTGWNKVGPGDKERIHNDDLTIPPDKSTIEVNYEDGSIMFKKGKDNSIGEALENILVVGKTVYLFSLSNEVIDSKSYEKGEENELKNKDLIPLSDIVLLECEVTEFQNKLITLKFVKSYDWDASKNTFITATGEKPDNSIRLVE